VRRQQGSKWVSIAGVSDSVTFKTYYDLATNVALAGSAANPYIAYYSAAIFFGEKSTVVVATPQDGVWKPIPSSAPSFFRS
jgi:hypothetical protein